MTHLGASTLGDRISPLSLARRPSLGCAMAGRPARGFPLDLRAGAFGPHPGRLQAGIKVFQVGNVGLVDHVAASLFSLTAKLQEVPSTVMCQPDAKVTQVAL